MACSCVEPRLPHGPVAAISEGLGVVYRTMATDASRRAVRDSFRGYVRAIGGGMLVGLPLLYTQEVWQHAFLIHPWQILFLLAVAFVIVVGYNAVSGFRPDASRLEILVDSVETLGLGILIATVALVLLGRLEPGIGLRDSVGKITLEAIPIAFGASVARTQFSGESQEAEAEEQEEEDDKPRVGPYGRLFVAAGGALLFALNIAPTEEPILLGIEAQWWQLLLIVAGSLALTYALVFYANFGGTRSAPVTGRPLDHPFGETLAAYAISLLVAYLLLWSFDRTDGASLRAILGMTILLGAVAAVGAAVGRLLVGGRGEEADADGDTDPDRRVQAEEQAAVG